MHRTPSSAEATPLQRRQIEELLVKKQELDCVLPKDGAVMIGDDRQARPVWGAHSNVKITAFPYVQCDE